MQVSKFQIGHGEVYAARYPQIQPAFLEVVQVQAWGALGRWIVTDMHEDGRAVPGTRRIHFGATDFLNLYRPATVMDFIPCRAIFVDGCGDGQCATCRGMRQEASQSRPAKPARRG